MILGLREHEMRKKYLLTPEKGQPAKTYPGIDTNLKVMLIQTMYKNEYAGASRFAYNWALAREKENYNPF